jgi:transposase
VIATLDQEIDALEGELSKVLAAEPTIQENYHRLVSIPGVGPRTARYLLSNLHELGSASPREITALAGLAPMNNDSGTLQGRRTTVRGGRRAIRAYLYMPLLGAIYRNNPRLKAHYEALVARGKPKKVAIIACMRKLIIWANALIAQGTFWNSSTTSIA